MPDDPPYYNSSSPRGIVFILNYVFENQGDKERKGTDQDVIKLRKAFRELDYIVEEHRDLTRAATIIAIRNLLCGRRMKKISSLIFVIMSHGLEGQTFMTSDNQFIFMEEMFDYCSDGKCPSLKGKPKIFVCQFCRGEDEASQLKQNGNPVSRVQDATSVTDAITYKVRDAVTDTLCIYASQEGFVAYRDIDNGTPFIDAFCKALKDRSYLDINAFIRHFNLKYRGMTNGQPFEVKQLGFEKSFCLNPPREITIRDNDISSMALTEMKKNPEKISIVIRGNPFRHPDLIQVLNTVADNRCEVTNLSLEYLFRYPNFMLQDRPLETAISKVMKKCRMKYYEGPVTPQMVLPETLSWLWASIADSESYMNLQRQLSQNLRHLRGLDLCLNIRMDPLIQKPLPGRLEIWLYLPNLQEDDGVIKRSNVIIKRLQSSNKRLSGIYFPRIRIESRNLLEYIQQLKVKKSVVCFPSVIEFSTTDEEERITAFVKKKFKCSDVFWGHPSIDGW